MPLISSILRAVEPIYVDRVAGKGGTVEIVKERINSPGNWLPIIIAPEGTMSNGRQLLGFKSGAFALGVPVQGVLHHYTIPEVGAWTNFSRGPIASFFLAISQWQNHLEMEYLPVYVPSAQEQADPLLYAVNFRRCVASALGVPGTEHTREDMLLMYHAVDAGLPADAALLEFNLMRRIFGVRLAELTVILDRYIRINTSKSGSVSQQEFFDYLHWPIEDQAKQLFAKYNTNSDCGQLRFREYVIGTLDVVIKVPNQDHLILAAFATLSNGQSQLTVESVSSCLQSLGFNGVKDAGVINFLYKMSQSGDLTVTGFADYVRSNPDLLVYISWLVDGEGSV